MDLPPTELSGEPVAVIATVTVNFVVISDGKHAAEPVGFLLRMDAAGILWDGDTRLEGKQLIDRAMEAGGAVRITPDPDVPLGILRETLQILHHAGIRVSVRVPSSQHDLIFESLVETTRKLGYRVVGLRMGFDADPSHSGWSKAKGPHDAELSLQYELAADEVGSVTAVKQVEGPEVPEITSALSQQRLEGYLFPSTIIVKIWLKKN